MYAYEVEGGAAFTVATCIYHPSSRGMLDVDAARRHVRAVTTVSCNILSEVQHDEQDWFLMEGDPELKV